MAKIVLALSPTDGTTWGSVATTGTVSQNPVVFTPAKTADGKTQTDPRK